MEICSRTNGSVKVPKSIGDGVSNFCYILELPECIAHEIFFRIPIKDIMQSKCVCTTWYKLISKPDFSDCYSKYSHFKPLLSFPTHQTLNFAELLEISETRIRIPSYLNPIMPPPGGHLAVSFIGMSNGLLCYLHRGPQLEIVNVINPIMGNPVALPGVERGYDTRCVKYHFGYNTSGDNFKVMRVSFKISRTNDMISSIVDECKIFTIGVDNQWRNLSQLSPMDLQFFPKTVSFEGALNWITHKAVLSRDPNTRKLARHYCILNLEICAFDLNEEKLNQFLGPPNLRLHCRHTPITIFDGRFGLVDLSNQLQITLWTMEKYAIAESWTKLVVLKSSMPPGLREPNACWWPIAKFKDGEILFVTSPGRQLFSCNIEEKKNSRIGMARFPGVQPLYAPSFFRRADRRGGAGPAGPS